MLCDWAVFVSVIDLYSMLGLFYKSAIGSSNVRLLSVFERRIRFSARCSTPWMSWPFTLLRGAGLGLPIFLGPMDWYGVEFRGSDLRARHVTCMGSMKSRSSRGSLRIHYKLKSQESRRNSLWQRSMMGLCDHLFECMMSSAGPFSPEPNEEVGASEETV